MIMHSEQRGSASESDRSVCAAAAAAAEASDAISRPVESRASPLVSDNEIIILNLKPSPLYILLASLGPLFGIAFLVLLLAYLRSLALPVISWSTMSIVVFAVVLVAVQIGWAFLDWMSRSYVLTDRRIIVTWGVLRRKHYQATLFHIQHIAVVQSIRERLFGLGTIMFATAGSATYDAAWIFLAKPFDHHRILVDAVDRYGGHHPST